MGREDEVGNKVVMKFLCFEQGFGSASFFADPDPGKNLHADPVPDPDPDPGVSGGGGWG